MLKNRSRHKFIKIIFIAIIVILILLARAKYIKMKPEIEINKKILESSNKIELNDIIELSLWKKTLAKLKNEQIKVEIQYNNCKITLNNKELTKKNNLEILIKKDENIEIDLSKLESTKHIDQIEIENNKLLSEYETIDIYAIHRESKKSEFIASKNLKEGNVILEPHEEYEKYLLTYTPIQKIITDDNEIKLYKNERYKIHFKIEPENATNKKVNIEYDDNLLKIKEDGSIEGVNEGKTEIIFKAENNTVTKKISAIIEAKEEIIQNSEENNISKKQIDVQEGNLSKNSIEKNYINGILLVNKEYNLPSDYNPGTNQEALQAFNNMKSEAIQSNISLWIVSGFRSYQTQESIFNRNVGLYGEETANTFSAKPGQSEHQTGLAFDINSTRWAFAESREAKWLAENCWKYGFIIRYPKGKEDITGYVYEPWHIRYVGKEQAQKIKDSGLCLEEYLEQIK